MIVVDLGCYDPPCGYDSLASLRETFSPDVLFGFDPQAQDSDETAGATRVVVEAKAAWIMDGIIGFAYRDTSSSIDSGASVTVPCFDFSAWLARLGEKAVVKMDVEGAEYELLAKMRADGTLSLVERLVIEWHGDPIETGVPTERWWN